MDEAPKFDVSSAGLSSAELLQLVMDTIPQKVFWKDFNSTYLGCNQLFAEDANLKSPDQIAGLTDFDLPWTEEEAKFYRLCDRRVMDRNQPEVGIVESQTMSNGEVTWLETNKVPLRDSSGKVIGMLGTYHDITKIKEAEQTLQRANEILEQRVENRTKELKHLAQHDSLTNLVNRSHFLVELNKAIESKTGFALLFIDLDRFKTINDSLGHAIGDKLLVEASKVLARAVRACDTVGRFGGDEFTILLRDVKNEPQVIQCSTRIQKLLGESIFVDNAHIVVSASIGFVIDQDNKYKSANNLLRDADIAMYEAKRAGKACHRLFSAEMLQRVSEKMNLEKQIRTGLANGQFYTVFQPIVDFEAGKIQSLEALVRWKHPGRGVVTPFEFLPLAEETGLIVEIGELVLEQSCRQLKTWKHQFPFLTDHLSVGINLSASQLLCDDFPEFLTAVMDANQLEPKDVNIEITESMILEERDSVEHILNWLRKRGHKLMLDDFGTGYSSLSYLNRFPIDTLKIDKSFVQAIGDDGSSRAIVETVVGLAGLLKMDVIAEGVETEQQEQHLLDMNCFQMQGYKFAKPMTAEDCTRCLGTFSMQALKPNASGKDA